MINMERIGKRRHGKNKLKSTYVPMSDMGIDHISCRIILKIRCKCTISILVRERSPLSHYSLINALTTS